MISLILHSESIRYSTVFPNRASVHHHRDARAGVSCILQKPKIHLISTEQSFFSAPENKNEDKETQKRAVTDDSCSKRISGRETQHLMMSVALTLSFTATDAFIQLLKSVFIFINL